MKNKRLLFLYLLAGLCIAAFLLYRVLPRYDDPVLEAQARQALRLMARAERTIRDCRTAKGVAIDPAADPNGIGLIGFRTSTITTSKGILEAKRTTTNPAFSGLIVRLLHQAGVRPGDVIAIGASSSFPGLIIATLAACKTLDVRPLLISSLGSSEWGANIPEFNWLDFEDCLNASGPLEVHPLGYSIGGDEDRGTDMDPAGRRLLLDGVRARNTQLLEEPDLVSTVAARMALYEKGAAGRPIKAFINIGGSWVNLGTDSRVLNVTPGLHLKGSLSEITAFPPPERSGMIFAMARRGVPVIHLLYIKGLCRDYGLPWDPQPLPKVE